ncbi:MAG: 5-dehydro-2-deoxygluconokinase [Kiloniellales bacterium]
MTGQPLDVICLGRASVDLYGEQVGGPLEDMQSFAKYVGGCATNIAIGTARLGLNSALITRVGDEQMGRYIRATLAAEGVDTSQLSTDPERLTALVILGIRDRETFPHIFYRTDCADMAIVPEHIDRDFIASARALLLTGTHFSAPGVEAASRTAIAYAREAGTRVIFDIDYRPVVWGLIGHAAGESRFVENAAVTEHLQSILPDCDLVVGTEEEIHIAGGATDTLEAVRRVRAQTEAAIVLKRGPAGCIVFPGEIPEHLDQGIVGPGFPVEVFNTLGAGDGFMSGFLRGWLRDQPWETCCRYGNAAGALVASRHGCSPASPGWEEMASFLEGGSNTTPLREDPRLNHLHRVTTRKRDWPEVRALAFDHRAQFEDLADRHGVARERIAEFKALVARGGERAVNGAAGGERAVNGAPGGIRAVNGATGAGALVDERYGADVLARFTGGTWWLARPVEVPGSRPLAFEAGTNLGLALRTWPEDHIAKCLVSYHPDDPPELRRLQDDRLHALYEACVTTRHELLVEVVPPCDLPADDASLARAMTAIYDRGVYPDWWKLPAPASKRAWTEISGVLDDRDRHCRGVVLLGLNAPEAELKRGFDLAADETWCKGFAVGRSIFQKPAESWFAGEIDDEAAIARIADNYRRVIALWENRGPRVSPAGDRGSEAAV